MALGYILFKPLFINFKNHKACIAKEWGKKKKEKKGKPTQKAECNTNDHNFTDELYI